MQIKEIEDLSEREEQLELYIEEKQDLLLVGVDQPHPLRSACSEEVLTVLSPPDLGFPTRTSSLMALPRGSEGDLPSCSNRLSTMLCDQSLEESNNSLFEGSEASMDLSSSLGEVSEDGQRKVNAKGEKLVKTAKSVTDRLYKAPEPKFKYQPKSKQLPRSTGATRDANIRTRDRRSPISPSRESPSRGTSARGSPARTKSESPRSTPRTTPSPRETPERQLKGNKDIGKSTKSTLSKNKDGKSSTEETSRITAKKSPSSGKSAGAERNTTGSVKVKGSSSRNSLSAGDLAGIRGRRESPTGSHGDISERRLSPSARKRDSGRLSPNSDSGSGGGRKFVPRLRHITSASSLANVPEAIAEETEPAEPEQKSTSQVVVRRRKKRPQLEGDEFRRHSEPLGEELAEAFDKYTQDFEQMEWQRAGSTSKESRENVLSWSGHQPQGIYNSIPGSTSCDDSEDPRNGIVDSESGVQTKELPTINIHECDDLDDKRLSREPSVYSETGSTVSETSTVVETEIDESEQVVFMEGAETFSDDEQPFASTSYQDLSEESPKPGSKRDHEVDQDGSQTVLVKVARKDDYSDINSNKSDNVTTSPLQEGLTGPSDSVSVSSDSLDDSKSVDSLECPNQRRDSLNDDDSLDDSLDESDLQKSDTVTSQTSVVFLSDSTSTELLASSCDGLDIPNDPESLERGEVNIPCETDKSQDIVQNSETVTMSGINECAESQKPKTSQLATEMPSYTRLDSVESSPNEAVNMQDLPHSEQNIKEPNLSETCHSSSETKEKIHSQQHGILENQDSRSRSEKSASDINEFVQQNTANSDNAISTQQKDVEPPTLQEEENVVKMGPNVMFELKEQITPGTHSTDTGPSVMDTGTDNHTSAAGPRDFMATENKDQDKIPESPSQMDTTRSQEEDSQEPMEESTKLNSDSLPNLYRDAASAADDKVSKLDKSETAEKACDGTPVEVKDTASQVDIVESPIKNTAVVSGIAIQTDPLFYPITNDTQRQKPEEASLEDMEVSASESGNLENEINSSLDGGSLEGQASKTVGVCTSPSLLCSHEDAHSCSNDSLQEVKEQLQELQEVLEGHIGIPAR